MIVGTNVAQQTEQCRMTLKNGRRCRYRSKHNGLCGRHWQDLMSNHLKVTRREWLLQWLQITANVAQVIGTGIVIGDHLRPKPSVTSIARVVTEKVMISGSMIVRMTGVAAVSAVGTVTVIQQPTSLMAAAKTGIALPVLVAAPVDVRRALWQIRVHPKKLAEVPAGRLRWNQLRFPNTPEKRAI